jgi:hypothetical protein
MRLSSFWEESFLFVPAGVVSSVLLGDSTLDKVHLSSPVQVRIEKTLDQRER